MAQSLTYLLSVLLPTYAFQYVGNPTSFFSMDEEEENDLGDDFDGNFEEEDTEDEDWFPGDDENGDADLDGYEDENYNY